MRIALLIALFAACAPRADAFQAPPSPVGARVLDLAFTRHDRLVALMDGALALFRVRGFELERLDERPLPTPGVVRLAAGILAAEPGGDTVWVATNRAYGAALYSTESDRLWEVERAAALPWPGVARGLTFRPGTNLIEGEMEGVGPGPFIRVGDGWAIDNDGALRVRGVAWPARLGSTAVRLSRRLFLASDAEPPGDRDPLKTWRIDEHGTAMRRESVIPDEMPGMVTALGAARERHGEGVTVVAALSSEGRSWLVVLGVFTDAQR